MKEILILTGACGVGKSTISKKWAKLKKGVVIESDYFRNWIYNEIYDKFSKNEEMLVANLTFVSAKEYLKHNMSVAIENVWTPLGLDKLKNAFENEFGNVDIKFVWLKCNLEENHRRDRLRVTENQMKDRVDIVNAELSEYKWPEYLNILDTTNLTEKETLNWIVEI
ncbi:MAG: AAA family ATPase [Flavobacteriaceae bacterium]|nr:AAA family ATPase [Flavobacteriaceae bacterium]